MLGISSGRVNVEEIASVFAQVLLLLFLALGAEEGKQILTGSGVRLGWSSARSWGAEAGRT